MSKQILDYTLIILAIMVSGLLGFCAAKNYVRKHFNSNLIDIQGQRLIDIELSMKTLENKIDTLQQKFDEDFEQDNGSQI